jgi:hypothetical protein
MSGGLTHFVLPRGTPPQHFIKMQRSQRRGLAFAQVPGVRLLFGPTQEGVWQSLVSVVCRGANLDRDYPACHTAMLHSHWTRSGVLTRAVLAAALSMAPTSTPSQSVPSPAVRWPHQHRGWPLPAAPQWRLRQRSSAPSAALTPLEQARHMHRAAQLAKRQAAAVPPASQTAATHGEATSQGALQQGGQQQQQQQQRQRQQQQAHAGASQPRQLAQAPLLSARDVVVQPPRTMSAAGLASLPPPQQPIGNSPHSSAAAANLPASQPAMWLGPGGNFASRAGGNSGGLANGMPCSSGEAVPGGNAGHTAHAVQYAGTGGGGNDSPWGNGRVSPAAGGQQRVGAGLQQRTAVPLQPLPLEGGPVAAADPGAEADLARARLALQCGQLSASDAAWKLLSSHASLRTS